MSRNSHLLLLSFPQTDTELDKENGVYSQALNTQNRARRSQEMRAPLGEVNFEISNETTTPKLKKR